MKNSLKKTKFLTRTKYLTMKNIACQTAKHSGLWSIAPQQPVLATFEGTMLPSIRGSYNDARMPGSFIEGAGYA